MSISEPTASASTRTAFILCDPSVMLFGTCLGFKFKHLNTHKYGMCSKLQLNIYVEVPKDYKDELLISHTSNFASVRIFANIYDSNAWELPWQMLGEGWIKAFNYPALLHREKTIPLSLSFSYYLHLRKLKVLNQHIICELTPRMRTIYTYNRSKKMLGKSCNKWRKIWTK